MMPFRLRFKYDRVYEANVNRIGLLNFPLSEHIPLFYTRLTSIMEDMVSLGDGTYSQVDLEILLRIYHDSHTLLQLTITQGEDIIQTIAKAYHLG
jgi:hypothetical protein